MCKKGAPVEQIPNIRRGRQSTQHVEKHRGQYGEPVKNNVGVSQWSEISAIRFVIYLDDMMEDYAAMNNHEIRNTWKTNT